MPVSALTPFDPSKFFQAPTADLSSSRRLDTKVSAVSAEDQSGRLSVMTAEGEKITLTADFEARYRAVNYQAKAETGQGMVEANATSVEASLKKQYGVTVEGDLNKQELHDLEKLFRKVSNTYLPQVFPRPGWRSVGQDGEAGREVQEAVILVQPGSQRQCRTIGDGRHSSGGLVRDRIAGVSGESTGSNSDLSQDIPIPSTAGTPGAAPSMTAAIPQSSTGTTAPTQPSADATAPETATTTCLVASAPDASQPKSLVQQVLAAFDEARVESEKIRKYLPDFLKKLREELSQEVRGEPGQEASACGLALSETRRGLVIPDLAVAVCALVRD